LKFLIFLFSTLSLAVGLGQTTSGTIAGKVTTAGGKPTAGAKVTLTRVETGAEREATSTAAGAFLFALAPAGEYRLTVKAPGEAAYERRIHLLVNQEVRVDVELAAQRRDTTEVTEMRSLVKPESASLGATIDNRMITGLPLDGRNFLDLSLLVPGATPAAQGSASSARNRPGDRASAICGCPAITAFSTSRFSRTSID